MLKGKIIFSGKIELLSPALIGSGESESTDLDVIKDRDGIPYIPATSLVGVLRHSIKPSPENIKNLEKFWGLARENQRGRQSSIFFSDLLPESIPSVSIRDGVKIDNKTGTAEEKGKFDYELIERGSKFNLFFEINLTGEDDQFKKSVASTIVKLLRDEKIRIGAKTNSGLGKITLKEANFYEFDFTKSDDVVKWFTYTSKGTLPKPTEFSYPPIELTQREFTVEASFVLKTSLIVREYNIDPNSPDTTHIKSAQVPVLPGTSFKGALRARAERILNTLGINTSLIDELFGFVDTKSGKAQKGRITVEESLIEGYPEEIQTRIKIDRFTGGTIEGALVETKPLFSTKAPKEFNLKVKVTDYKDHEVGLILLLLKDLWTGDLPIGGEKSIGRGVLEGRKAKIYLDGRTIEFDSPAKLTEEQKKLLNSFVESLVRQGGKQ